TPIEPFDLIIFGGTGDLAMRKLLPALYRRVSAGQLPAGSRILGVAREAYPTDAYRKAAEQALLLAVPDADRDGLARFLAQLGYQTLDVQTGAGWPEFASACAASIPRRRVFYLATSPRLYAEICARLQQHGLNGAHSRVVIEKPIGHDLASARAINAAIGSVFSEDQTFRIDHYLGKETVQNLMVLRFGNTLFEPLWNAGHIERVQITVAETVGVESRGKFYEVTGALRDMVPNHVFSLLSLVAMEPPTGFDAAAIRSKKAEVFAAMPAVEPEQAVRGQYGSGTVLGKAVKSYRNEPNVASDSNIETYAAMRLEIDNWRWAGVPFYFRTGKHMSQRLTEIAIRFKQAPFAPFQDTPV
ncbi:MAG: glucose-6-phosphate dehydrogenase, partial [Pseudomonadota bacterium]